MVRHGVDAEQSGAAGAVFAAASADSALEEQQPSGEPPPVDAGDAARAAVMAMDNESANMCCAMRLDSAGGSTEQDRLAYQSLVVDALVLCTKHGVFNSADAARMRAVSKTLRDPIRLEFNQVQIRKATIVYDTVHAVAHKATTGVKGTSGSLNAGSFVRVFDYLDGGIYGKRFFDAGSGCGMAVLTAAFLGGSVCNRGRPN